MRTIPLLLLSAALLLGGCAQTIPVTRTSLVPAVVAEGQVDRDDNGNTVVNLKVERLAPAANLTPPRKVYLVWLEAEAKDDEDQGKTVLMGQLRLSEEGSGEFRATSPMHRFRLKVTAEDEIHPTAPGDQMVLSTGMISVK